MKAGKLFATMPVIIFFMTSCDLFKTKYEEIAPELPEIEEDIVPIAKADYNWKLQGLDSAEVDFSDFAGTVVFLNFWETWCVPCRLEMPKIEKLSRACEGKAEFVLVSPENLTLIRRFADSTDIALPLYRLNSELPEVFNGPGIPRTYILDKNGSVVFREFRSAKWDDESCIEFIERLAK